MKIRVLIVEDHPLMQAGLAQALESDPDFELVGRAADGAEGLELGRQLKPDVMILDLHLPSMGGITVLEHVREASPGTRVLIVTASEQADDLLNAVAAGATGYMTKRSQPAEIRNAVVTVHAGGSIITPALAAHLLREYSYASRGEGSSARPLLTAREQEVLRMLAQGHTDKEIAARLFLSVRTVQNHLASVRFKTGLRRRAQLARWATEHSL